MEPDFDPDSGWLGLTARLVFGFALGTGLVALLRSQGFHVNAWPASLGAIGLGSVGPLYDRGARLKACLALAPIAGLIFLFVLDGRFGHAGMVGAVGGVAVALQVFIGVTLVKWFRERNTAR